MVGLLNVNVLVALLVREHEHHALAKAPIFVETVSDYPLVEAIHQNVVRHPVLPDAASRARLHGQVENSTRRRSICLVGIYLAGPGVQHENPG